MAERSQDSVYYIRYKDIVLQKAKEYREKNKEKLKKYLEKRYKNLRRKKQTS